MLVVDSLCFEGAYSEETIEELSELYLAFYRRLAVIVVVVPNNLLSIQAIVKKNTQQEHLDRILYS